MSIIMVYWDWKDNLRSLSPTNKNIKSENIAHRSGANINGRVTKRESVHSLIVTGTQTLSCTLGLQARQYREKPIIFTYIS